MNKTITFSFESTEYEGTKATETFSLEKLGIGENLDEDTLQKELNRIFEAWVWQKLNISSSIIVEDVKSVKNNDWNLKSAK